MMNTRLVELIALVLLCVLLAYTAYERGPVAGASAGLGLGLTADLCAGTGERKNGYLPFSALPRK